MVHPWHDISPGDQVPEFVNGIIEIKRGSRAKYEVDKEYGILKLDRVLYSSFYYPANYGFIPQSYCGDHDPLDILVLSQVELEPLCLVKSKVIGVMRMLDSGEEDDKIIAVAANDMSVNHINDISELPPHFTLELKHFFEDYKKLENKTVVIEDFQNAELARKIVLDSLELYKKTFPKK
ncbi:inorganic diphosphatase [Leptospira alstonii]|uniref:Inorganic pyrophosphatase n=2 Tax=Leptospira alstonii TaxID=28452 RepID=M6D4Q8_9LEPT|nr:inorganic diphosphatase [Leptospira alstonii]EMJ97676.1 inorganic diphosphatase [Leptospira alstonii serovar Sichuan str. 79601]EQA79372.1 inorganic diphosphatase [Leptospira alstonii serovar Pingchang str. 80-412]